jgi:hypothetical protein
VRVAPIPAREQTGEATPDYVPDTFFDSKHSVIP